MRKLPISLQFYIEKLPGYSDLDVVALNFELIRVLEPFEFESKAYMDRAKAFHAEVKRRRPPSPS
jgi:hypothetical protein